MICGARGLVADESQQGLIRDILGEAWTDKVQQESWIGQFFEQMARLPAERVDTIKTRVEEWHQKIHDKYIGRVTGEDLEYMQKLKESIAPGLDGILETMAMLVGPESKEFAQIEDFTAALKEGFDEIMKGMGDYFEERSINFCEKVRTDFILEKLNERREKEGLPTTSRVKSDDESIVYGLEAIYFRSIGSLYLLFASVWHSKRFPDYHSKTRECVSWEGLQKEYGTMIAERLPEVDIPRFCNRILSSYRSKKTLDEAVFGELFGELRGDARDFAIMLIPSLAVLDHPLSRVLTAVMVIDGRKTTGWYNWHPIVRISFE